MSLVLDVVDVAVVTSSVVLHHFNPFSLSHLDRINIVVFVVVDSISLFR